MAAKASTYLEDFKRSNNGITDSGSSSGSKTDLAGGASTLSLENISHEDIGKYLQGCVVL